PTDIYTLSLHDALPISLWGVYRTYFVFGQTIIDKVAISSGLRNRFTYEFDGIENLKEALSAQRGGILISAHVGNFEIAEKFFADIDVDFKINLVTAEIGRASCRERVWILRGVVV